MKIMFLLLTIFTALNGDSFVWHTPLDNKDIQDMGSSMATPDNRRTASLVLQSQLQDYYDKVGGYFTNLRERID